MPDQNVEKAERLIEAWNREDWGSIEALFHPDAEAQAPAGWPEAEDAEGWPAIKRQFDRLRDAWSEDRIDIADSEAVEDDVVLLHVHWRTRGKESGIDVDFEAWIVARFRARKIEKAEFYLEREQAMRACGRTAA
jgi:ketosteroid isomerase-like protein